MKYLFTSSGTSVMESLSFTRTLYAFDFDGTLAPIVATPEAARMRASTETLLRSLSEKAPVAIISGRSIADLKSRLNFSPQSLVGNHGLEGLSLKKESAQQAHGLCQAWKRQIERHLDPSSGVSLEDKTYSLAIHYRNSRNKKAVRLSLFQMLERLDPPPRVVLGKCVMNLIPSGAPHKGVALLELMMQMNLKCAFYIGDDDTDEDVFSLPDSRIITVRVGQRRSSQAQYYVKSQGEVSRVIREIIKRVERCQKMSK